MKCITLIIAVLISFTVSGQNNSVATTIKDSIPVDFSTYVNTILKDSLNLYSDYPKQPAPSPALLSGLATELKNDSAALYFENLSTKYRNNHERMQKSVAFFESENDIYCLMATAIHWNPDLRILALKSLYQRKQLQATIRTTKEKYQQLQQEDTIILHFLIDLLEYNPLFIDGSENATIHQVYMTNLMMNLDLYTGENVMNGRKDMGWFKTAATYQAGLANWKRHL